MKNIARQKIPMALKGLVINYLPKLDFAHPMHSKEEIIHAVFVQSILFILLVVNPMMFLKSFF